MQTTRRQFNSVALLAASTIAIPSFAQEHESTFARVKRTGRLRLGAVAGASPYSVRDLASGEWKGFCADFGRDLARYLKVEVEWVETSWGNSVLDLQGNKIDAHFGLAPTEQRRQAIDFSDRLFQNMNTVVANKSLKFRTWDDLNKPGIKVAVDAGSSHDQAASRLLSKASIVRFESIPAATLALQSRRADCQVLAILVSSALLGKMPNIGKLVIPEPQDTNPTCIGLRRQPDQQFMLAVNGWIAEARAAGRVRETIVGNMQKLANVPPSTFPPELQF